MPLTAYNEDLIFMLPDCLRTRMEIAGEPHPELGTPCWLWIGRLNRNGYGRVNINGKEPVAHRASYECLAGPIPAGLILDHKCRTRRCINPWHAEPVTHRENTIRGDAVLFTRKNDKDDNLCEGDRGFDFAAWYPTDDHAVEVPEVHPRRVYDAPCLFPECQFLSCDSG